MLAGSFSDQEMLEFLKKKGYEKITFQVWDNAERGNDVVYDYFSGVIKNGEGLTFNETPHVYEAELKYSIKRNFENELKKALLSL